MFANPLGLLGLLAVPTILVLHLFRRRVRIQTVSAVFLWESVGADPSGGRSREPLRRNVSLLAEILSAILLSLALAGPRLGGGEKAEHLVLMLDGTASMEATAFGESAAERMRAAARSRVRAIGRSSRVSVVLTGPEPSVIAGPLAFPAQAIEAIERVETRAAGHDLDAAVALATELSYGGPVTYFTDRLPGSTEPGSAASAGPLAGLEVVALGAPASNVGIVSAQRTEAGRDTDRITLTLRNFGDQDTRRAVAFGATDGSEGPAAEAVSLPAGGARSLAVSVPSSAGPIVARLATLGDDADALAMDDEAVLVSPPRRVLRLAVTLDDAASQALGLGPRAGAAERWAGLASGARAADNIAAAHLVLGTVPAAGGAWSLLVQPPTETPSHFVGPFLIERSHPLLAGVTLDGVVWSTDESREPTGRALILAGESPLATETFTLTGQRVWNLGVVPGATNLSRSADWPILLKNAADVRRAELPGPSATSVTVGESVRWSGAPAATWTLRSPTGNETTLERLPDGFLVTPRLGEPGLWSLAPAAGGPGTAGGIGIGVSLASADESDLRGAAEGIQKGPAAIQAPEVSTDDAASWLETLLLVLGLAFMTLDWWVLRAGGKGS